MAFSFLGRFEAAWVVDDNLSGLVGCDTQVTDNDSDKHYRNRKPTPCLYPANSRGIHALHLLKIISLT
jgi:hypothetical protein